MFYQVLLQHVYVVMLHNDGYPYFMLSFRVASNREDLIPCDISPRVHVYTGQQLGKVSLSITAENPFPP